MQIQSLKRFKRVALILFTIICVSMLPVFPEGALDTPDPVSIDDIRVKAKIDDAQFMELLSIVRQPVWAGLWGLISRMGEGREVILMRDGDDGGIEVQIGHVKAPLQGRGKVILLQEEENGWKIIKVSNWYS